MDQSAEIGSAFDELLRISKQLRADLVRLESLLAKGRAGKSFAALDELRKNPDLFTRLNASIGGLVGGDALERAQVAIRDAIETARTTYRTDLESAVREAGISIQGEWPAYWLDSVLRLQVDFQNDRVRVGTRQLTTLDPVRVVATARVELKRLTGRPFDPVSFSRLIADSYERIVGEGRIASGEYADINEVLKGIQAGAYGRTYSAPLFGVDLLRLREVGATDLRVELSPARGPANGLLIPGPDGGYVSGLRVLANTATTNG
jgi:hypothetical protein